VTASPAAIGQVDGTWTILPDDPFATTDRLPDGVSPDRVSRFGDQRWNYTVLSRRRSEVGKTVNWAAFPEILRESFRRAGWALVNLPTPTALLDRAATARVEWPAPGTMDQVFRGWRRFAVWLVAHRFTGLREVDDDLLADYAVHVGRRGCSTAIAQDDLNAVTLLWGFAPHLLAGDRIPMPPWEKDGVKHYLGTDATSNENTTPAIHPAVMSPLLIWSLRFLDFADDIIAAWREHQRLLTLVRDQPNPDATAALRAFLNEWVTEHGELPGGVARGRRGLAAQYLAGMFETSERHVKYEAAKYRERNVPVGMDAPLASPVNGMIHGRKWKPHIHFHEAPRLLTRLATAAMVVTLYLKRCPPRRSARTPGRLLSRPDRRRHRQHPLPAARPVLQRRTQPRRHTRPRRRRPRGPLDRDPAGRRRDPGARKHRRRTAAVPREPALDHRRPAARRRCDDDTGRQRPDRIVHRMGQRLRRPQRPCR
jgi:hypothetical protein